MPYLYFDILKKLFGDEENVKISLEIADWNEYDQNATVCTVQWVFVAAQEHSKKKCEIQIRQFSATFGICINKFIDSPAILYKIEQENFRKNRINSDFDTL